MSILIDDLVNEENTITNQQKISGGWFIAKPITNFSFKRINDALRVLSGKSFAVHYKEDEK